MLAKPPPLWLVTDGVKMAGPVSTTLLIKSARKGLSRQVQVRATRASIWRPLGQLREIRAFDESAFERQRRLSGMSGLLGLETLLRLSEHSEETLSLGLRVAAHRLGADFGFVHCFERGRATPVTRFGFGQGASGRIGAPILSNDILTYVARTRRLAVGDAQTHHGFRVAASRLGGRAGEVAGVAMVPIFVANRIVATVELGRIDHSFRGADGTALRAIADLVVGRLSSHR
jgi:hypothetical protein